MTTTPYYAKGDSGKAFMTVANATAAPNLGVQIELVVDDHLVADDGDYIVLKGLGHFLVDNLVADGRRMLVTNQNVTPGTAIPAGTKVFVDLSQYTPSAPDVPTPNFNALAATGPEVSVTWDVGTSPAWVGVQYWKYGDPGTSEFKYARGIDGVVKFTVPWKEATYVRGWGEDSNSRKSEIHEFGYISAVIPTPTGVTVTPGAGTLKVEWTHTGYETWVQIWRKGLDDFKSQDIEPLDDLGGQITSVEFDQLPPGNYYVRLYHHDSINWSDVWWSDNGSKDGNGPGWSVTSNLVNPDVPTPDWLPLEADDDELIVKWNIGAGVAKPARVVVQYWKTGEVESNKFAEALGSTGELRIKTGWQGLTFARGWGVDSSGYWDSEEGTPLGDISIGLPAPVITAITSPEAGKLKVTWTHVSLMTWVQVWRKNQDDYKSLYTWAYDDTGSPINSITFDNLPAGDYYVRAYHYVEVGSPFSPVAWSDNGINDGTGPGYAVAAITPGTVSVDQPTIVTSGYNATSGQVYVTWNPTGAPDFVQIQIYDSTNWANNDFRTVPGAWGTTGVIFTVPTNWSETLNVRGWGIDEDGNRSAELIIENNLNSPKIPRPANVVVTPMPNGEKGVLEVSWLFKPYNTWVQIWRKGVEDYLVGETNPYDSLSPANQINSITFTGLPTGFYYVRIMHFTKYANPQQWSEEDWSDGATRWGSVGNADGTGVGYEVEQVPGSGDVTSAALAVGVSIPTGGIQFSGDQGFIKKTYSGYTTPGASAGFFLGVGGSPAAPGFLIGTTSTYLQYRGDTGALNFVGGNISIGTGNNNFEVTPTYLKYGGTSGLNVDAGGAGSTVLLTLGDRGGFDKMSLFATTDTTEIELYNGASNAALLQVDATSARLALDHASSAVIEIDGNQVLGAQQAAITDSVGGDEQTKINAILTALRNHGLIAT